MRGLTDSIRELLGGRHYATLATLDPDGAIHPTPVWYLFENDKFYVESPSSSRKARNLAARPRATLLVDIRRAGMERWVSASGAAEIIRGESSREINSRIMRRYLTNEAMEDPRIGPALAAADDVTLCLIPTSWRSWAAKDMDQQFFGGILCRTPERWFLPVV